MNSSLEQAQLLGRIWMDFAARMTSAGLAFRPDETPPDAARDVRSATFRAMSESADQFMRTPMFLEMMKRSLDASLNFREQYNDLLTRTRHETQGVARQDVDSLLKSVRHLETRILDAIESLELRVNDLAERLDRLERPERASGDDSEPAGGSHE